jgi:DNA polymerase-3 subunit beta
MRLTVARGALLESLNVTTKAVSARTTLPILSGVLLTAAKDGVVLQATDLEVSVRNTVPAEVETEGSAVLPGRLFADLVRRLPDVALSLDSSGPDKITLSCNSEKAGEISFELRTLSPEDFPRFPEVTPESSVTIPTAQLSSMVRQVTKAVSRDEARPILTGILLVIEGEEIRMVATDSYRLAVRTATMEEPVAARVEVIVPGKALDEVSKIAAGADAVTLGVSENQVVFNVGTTVYVTRRIEGSFPNYRQLIPTEGETSMDIDREELLEAIGRVSLLAQHNAPLRLRVADSTLTLTAATQEVGEASESLMAETEGQPLEIGFNHAFLLDGVSAADEERISFMASGPLKPGVFRSGAGGEYTYLVMPVRP